MIFLNFTRERNVKGVPDIVDLQNDYVLDLQKEAGHEFGKFYGYRDVMKKWLDDKVNKDLYTFRDQIFTSVITGIESPRNKTKFMDNLDDSAASILNQCK